MKKFESKKKSLVDKDSSSSISFPSSISSAKVNNSYAIYAPLCKDTLVSKYMNQEARPSLSSFKSPSDFSFPLQRQSRQFNEMNEKKNGKKMKKKSIYKGVFTCGKKFKAQIQAFGVQHYLGLYKTAEEAARSYDSHARMMLGNKAKTNFQYEAPIVPLQEKKMTKKDKNLKRIYVGIKTKKFRYNYPSKQFYLTKEKLETIGNFLNYFGYKLLPANQCSIVNHSSHNLNLTRLSLNKDSVYNNSENENKKNEFSNEKNYIQNELNSTMYSSTYSSMNFLLNLPSHTIIRYNSLPIPSNAIAVSNNLNYFNMNHFLLLNDCEEKNKSNNNYYFITKKNNLTNRIYSKYMKKEENYNQLNEELAKKNNSSSNSTTKIDVNKSISYSNPSSTTIPCSNISSLSILHCINQPYYEVSSNIPLESSINFVNIPRIRAI